MSERVKLRAQFWNGLAIAAVGGIIVPALDTYRHPAIYNSTVYPVLSPIAFKHLISIVAGCFAAFFLRLHADSIIKQIDLPKNKGLDRRQLE